MSDDSFSRRLSALASRRRAEPPAPPVFKPQDDEPVAAPAQATVAVAVAAEMPAAPQPDVVPSEAKPEFRPEPPAAPSPALEPVLVRAPVSAPPIVPDLAPSVPDEPEPEAEPEPARTPPPALGEDEMEMLRARLAARRPEIVATEEAAATETPAPILAPQPAIQSAPTPAPLALPPELTGEPVASAVEAAPAVPFAPEPPFAEVPASAPVEPEPALESAPEPTTEAERQLPPGMLMSFRPRERKPEEKRPFDPDAPRNRSAGYVVSCSGDHAIVRADTGCFDTVTGDQWAVGRLLSVRVDDRSRIVALVHHVETPLEGYDPDAETSMLLLHVELQGAVVDKPDGTSKFAKGIDSYPAIGAIAHQIRSSDLAAIYAAGGDAVAEIGHLSQDHEVPAFVDIEDMISKHFAVLGSTGCGKSCSVSLLLHASQEIMPDLRVLILDPHNEYSCAFPDSTTITIEDLDLPFWMFQLDEYVECLFRGKPVVQEEVDALRDFIPKAKVRFREGEGTVSLRSSGGGMNPANSITADTPLPYRISDVLACLEEELGLLDSKMDKQVLKSLKNRIDTHSNDPRFAFMFRHRTITDVASDVVGRLFAMAPDTKGLTTILQMAGMAAEVVNSCASVLCRMAFELSIAAKGRMKVLVVCEEAHRYVPRDAAAAFGPTRQAIARIAKEGRKYGCFMSIVSQRPAELDPTILSQCCTVFSLRLSNDSDQAIIRKSISTGSESAIKFLSSIGNREAIAFGEGFSTPMRMKFANLPIKWLPGQDSDVFGKMGGEQVPLTLDTVMGAWRGGGH